MLKIKLCEDVEKVLKATREIRGDNPVNGERVKEAFGLKGDDLTLKDLTDIQLLQALFLEANWALSQQAQELQARRAMAAQPRRVRRAARR